MAKKEIKEAFDIEITPFEFEKMLKIYGMSKKEYCEIRNKQKSWFYSVFRQRKYLNRVDILKLMEQIGDAEFMLLLKTVKPDVFLDKEKGFIDDGE